MSQQIVALFSGQGSQKVGMGQDLAAVSETARQRFARADEVLGTGLTDVMFNGPEEKLTRTSWCQPALYVHGLVCLELLRERVPGLEVVACAGLSLGEFTAHTAAGTFSLDDGLRLVAKRGAFMEEACGQSHGAMAALMGGEEEDARRLAAEVGVDVANFNAPGQIVISGSVGGIEQAVARAKEFGVRRAIPLKVAGAYHSRLMQVAQDRLAAELAAVTMQEPVLPVVCNVDARVVSGADEIRSALVRQVTGSVRWSESIRVLRAAGHQVFVEFGPGKVVAGLVGKIDPGAVVHAVDDVVSLAAVAQALGGGD